MDDLHAVLRAIRSENKSRRDHMSVFREFLNHLDRVRTRKAGGSRAPLSRKTGRR